jgi:hypothetical protein
MASIVLRSVKGSPLTIAEADGNFSNLNAEVGAKLDAANYTAADVLTKIKTVDGDGSGLDADLLDGLETSSTNTGDTVVVRDSAGDFSANSITAVGFTGNLTGNVIGNLTGTVTGNATNVDGTVTINHGGTGGTTAQEARENLGLGDIVTLDASNVNFTGGTITGITDLAIADGGTGASNATAARTNLGLVIGQDVQPFNNELTAFSSLTTTGIVVKTGTGTAETRSISASTNISITDGDGVDDNIVITGSKTPTVTSIIKDGTDGTGDIGQSNNKFGTIYGTASSATYADLAEKYLPDSDYPVGTVMTVGGEKEVTACRVYSRAIGVISENPAYMMNSELEGGVYVALKGRVPVRCVGPVEKGDELVPTEDGNAYASGNGKVFAVALESKSGAEVKLVEAVIL